MGELLGELGKKLAERWLSLLVLPGTLYLAVGAAAVTLGHAHALDVARLVGAITRYAGNAAVTTVGGHMAVLVAVLGGAAAAGLIAQSLGSLTERLVLAAGWQAWPEPFRQMIDNRVTARQKRWDDLHEVLRAQERRALSPSPGVRPDPALLRRAGQRRSRVSAERPERPTWSGDRVHAAALRLDEQYHLDLALVWPHLWLVLPETVRTEIITARAALARAAALAGWTVLYAALSWWWWPAAPLVLILALTARHRVRTTTAAYADLLEAVSRIHATTLANALGVGHTGPLTPELGDTLYRLLHVRLAPPEPVPPNAPIQEPTP